MILCFHFILKSLAGSDAVFICYLDAEAEAGRQKLLQMCPTLTRFCEGPQEM